MSGPVSPSLQDHGIAETGNAKAANSGQEGGDGT